MQGLYIIRKIYTIYSITHLFKGNNSVISVGFIKENIKVKTFTIPLIVYYPPVN